MNDTPQRKALGAFIRARREALIAEHAMGRRRTSGLRREEAAQRCGLSTTLYTWIEQGRDTSLTTRTLTLLSEGLNLTPVERAYLFELGRRRDPATIAPLPALSPLPPALLASLNVIQAPTYVLDARFTARAWNPAARDLFAPWYQSQEANLLRFVFLVPTARIFIQDWASNARRLVAEFRGETVRAPEDPHRARLLDELHQSSSDFRQFWKAQDVQSRSGGNRCFLHPVKGLLHYTQVNFLYASPEPYRLTILLPHSSQAISEETVISDKIVDTNMAREVIAASRS